jgi:heme-degrading monooxygenase HmoA
VIAVIFEARPRAGRRQAYLDTAGKILSLWRDEQAVERWRNVEAHRRAQDAGRRSIFADYRLRVARVLRDYGMHERDQAPAQ